MTFPAAVLTLLVANYVFKRIVRALERHQPDGRSFLHGVFCAVCVPLAAWGCGVTLLMCGDAIKGAVSGLEGALARQTAPIQVATLLSLVVVWQLGKEGARWVFQALQEEQARERADATDQDAPTAIPQEAAPRVQEPFRPLPYVMEYAAARQAPARHPWLWTFAAGALLLAALLELAKALFFRLVLND